MTNELVQAPRGLAREATVTVIVTHRAAAFLRECLDAALEATTGPVLVVDNASSDGTTDVLAAAIIGSPRQLEVVRSERNLGFAGGVAYALSLLSERVVVPTYVALLNDDAVAEPDWLVAPVAILDEHADVAAVTSKISLRGSGAMNSAGGALTAHGYGYDVGFGEPAEAFETPTDVFAFCGAAAVLRYEAVRQVGGFPTDFFLYYEDTDTSFRLRLAGLRIRYEPRSRVRHAHSATTNQRSYLFAYHNERNRLAMLIRCAPASVALTELARFAITTASLTARRLRQPKRTELNLSPRLRVAVAWGLLRWAPALVGQRRALGVSAAIRRDVWTSWAGRPLGTMSTEARQ